VYLSILTLPKSFDVILVDTRHFTMGVLHRQIFVQFSFDFEPPGASHQQYLKIYEVANFKGYISSSLISLTLLTRLGDPQVLPNHLDLFLGVI
jgi:hypothetical protein